MPNPSSAGLPNPAHYTDLGDGTVRDEVTGLVWQKAVEIQETFDGAAAYCKQLALAGGGFRVPKRVELLSLVDFTRGSPAYDVNAFPKTSGFYWTSSPWVVSQIATKPQRSWIVNFAEGLTSNNGDRTQKYNVRCVKGEDDGVTAIPADLYASSDPGEVRDQRTGLIWQAGDSTDLVDLATAKAYCPGLALNGHAWRLPSIKELSTLVFETPSISAVSPAIDTAHFPGAAKSDPYWSSSEFVAWKLDTGTPQWVISFLDGFTQYGKDAARVRCVR